MDLKLIERHMIELVEKNRWNEKNSNKPQTAENIAKSICIESAELLECYQWTNCPNIKKLEDEIADIILYSVHFANIANIDLESALKNKIQKNRKRSWS